MNNHQTLGEFIIKNQKGFHFASGELSKILSSIKLASKIVNREVNKAGLADILGASGSENIQGETQQKLDVFANDVFIKALTSRGVVCGIGSEENDDFISIKATQTQEKTPSKYVILMDPLDGSSNIDVNVSVGTIFSVYKRITPINQEVELKDFLQEGNKQVAAGYVIYGSSTMLVYSTGDGVNGFTLDPSLGTYYLSHPNLRFPKTGNIYSINEANRDDFNENVKTYMSYCQSESNSKKRYTSRYIGSLVADFHRNLIKGGIYMYPSLGEKYPKGKLRLLYECNPIAFLTEQAGGSATDGNQRIMDIIPNELHQRAPFFCGSSKMVEEFLEISQQESSKIITG